MKKLSIVAAAMLTLGLSSGIYAQQSQVQTQTTGAPQAFKYQAVARNANGNVIANQPVSFRITILQGSAEGTSVYQETQTAITNQFGLANLSIGNGSAVSGTFNDIDWSTGSYFIKTEFDPKGGENYTVMGTSQMMSVPYSLYAEHAKTADNVTSFPLKAALQATNLQAPFDAPAAGTLVYNTDSAGTGIYAVVPGYYYNAGTGTDPKWVLMSGGYDYAWDKKPMTTSCTGTSTITTYGGAIQDGIVGAGVGNPSGADNTGFGYLVFSGANCGGTGTSGTDNTGVGYEALQANTTGETNTAIGSQAMTANTAGTDNTAVGYQALLNNTTIGGISGSGNVAIGSGALSANTTAGSNIAVGYGALHQNTTGQSNIAIGSATMADNTTGSSNTAVGYVAMNRNTIGVNNTAVGQWALEFNTTAGDNTALGYQSLYANNYTNSNTAYSTYNVAIGENALFNSSPTKTSPYIDGSRNTALGTNSLYYNTNGLDNTATGYNALYGANNSGNFSTGSGNVATGAYALGSYTAASWNTAVGDSAMFKNTTGEYNVAEGYEALALNTTGNYNTANGYNALYNNTASNNMAVGFEALYTNTTGTDNISLGNSALYYNQTGNYNTATGVAALYNNTASNNTANGYAALDNNTSGSYNTGFGYGSLFTNQTGGYNTVLGANALYYNTASYNTAVGYNALNSNTTGSENTAIGYGADCGAASSNCTVVGYGATLTTGTSNTVYLGNSAITTISGAVAFTHPSDGRIKKQIQENVPGLQFIMKLRPVTYHFDMNKWAEIIHLPDSMRLKNAEIEKEKIQYTGFIAQEVEKSARECGYDFSGVVAPKNENSTYEVAYSDFVVPIVKAIQDQQQIIDSQNDKISNQEKEIEELRKMIESMVVQKK